MIRLVKPVPAPVVIVATTSAATNRSAAVVVVTVALLVLPLPVPVAVTSTGAIGSAPLYSRIRTSGNAAAPLNVTVTVLLPAAAAMFFA